MHLEQLIADWGYLAVFFAAFLEGEVALLMTGILSGAGLLWWPLATVCGASGTICGTQIWYGVGRIAGDRVLASRPEMQERVLHVQEQFHQRGLWLMIFYRFAYGLRAITPFALGAARVSPWKYMPFDAICWFVWLACVSGLGWWLGKPALALFESVVGTGGPVVAMVLVVVLVGAVFMGRRT